VQECNSRAERAALRAVELDEELAEAHASLGNLRTRQWNWSAAEKEFEQAIRLNPNYAEVHNWYAVHLHLLGRGDDAFLENERALELDPLSVVFRSTRGKLLYFARRYDLALEQLLKTLDLEPGFGVARYCLALVDEAKGCYDDARVALGQAMTFFGSDPELMAGLGRVHAMSGRRREAVDVIDELTRLSKERYVEPYFLAWIHEALGEKDEAFCWLERICGA
jgi:tetratricopeptide (TPR) repeat protein